MLIFVKEIIINVKHISIDELLKLIYSNDAKKSDKIREKLEELIPV